MAHRSPDSSSNPMVNRHTLRLKHSSAASLSARISPSSPKVKNGAYVLTDHELAAALSYTLWGTTPDEALLVDPPRSGLGRFAQRLADAKDGPSALLYVSCAAESFITDLGTLAPAGWRVRSLTLVDQLPQTPHGEWVALVTR